MRAAGGYSIEITKILIDHPGVELNLTNKVRCVLSIIALIMICR